MQKIRKKFGDIKKKQYLCAKFMPNGEYILWEFLDHKIYKKDIWKLK